MRRPVSTRSADPPPPPQEILIQRIGADGDGVAQADAGLLYIPQTLPGETVLATPVTRLGHGWAATGIVTTPSDDRVPPPCPHFGVCGGCVLQHWQAAPYLAWKQAQLHHALLRAEYVSPPVAQTMPTPPQARRRIDLAITRTGPAIVIGLHTRRSAAVFDMQACTILHPALFALVAPLRVMVRRLSSLRRSGSAILNLLNTGPDLLLQLDGVPSTADRAILAGFAERNGVARIAWRGTGPAETAAQLRRPTIRFGTMLVTPPSGSFLQASEAGEAAILASVAAGLKGLKRNARIVEFYAGIGTLTALLARHGRVTAYEGDADAVTALRAASGDLPIEVCLRDLQRQPVMASDFARADAIVLDPPFRGAGPQIAQIAASRVKRVIYVSCNPAALAADAAILRAAGYGLASAVPIDQFLWSSDVESVVTFTHAGVRDANR